MWWHFILAATPTGQSPELLPRMTSDLVLLPAFLILALDGGFQARGKQPLECLGQVQAPRPPSVRAFRVTVRAEAQEY